MKRGTVRPRSGLTVLATLGLGALVAGTLVAASMVAQQTASTSPEAARLEVVTPRRAAAEPIVLRAPSGSAAPSRSVARAGVQTPEIPAVSEGTGGLPILEVTELDLASGLPDLGVTGLDVAPSLPAPPRTVAVGSSDATELDLAGSLSSQLGMPSLIASNPAGEGDSKAAKSAKTASRTNKEKPATKPRATEPHATKARQSNGKAAGDVRRHDKTKVDRHRGKDKSASASGKRQSKGKPASPQSNSGGNSRPDKNKKN